MIERVNVIGSGRVGSAIVARLRERGIVVNPDDPDLVLLCVPDTAISDVSTGWPPRCTDSTPANVIPEVSRVRSTG